MALVGLLVAGVAPTPEPLAAQTPAEAVESVARSVLQGISEGRTDLLEDALHADAVLMAVPAAGTPRRQERDAFLEAVATSEGRFEERMWDPVVQVDGPVAMVWTPYDFWMDGQFSHCGVDAFQLIRENDVWKVLAVVYTMEYGEDCEPSPLGPPGGA
jgi:hypothetical protein